MLLTFSCLVNFRKEHQWELEEGRKNKPKTSLGPESPFRHCLWDMLVKLGGRDLDAVWEDVSVICTREGMLQPPGGLTGCAVGRALLLLGWYWEGHCFALPVTFHLLFWTFLSLFLERALCFIPSPHCLATPKASGVKNSI